PALIIATDRVRLQRFMLAVLVFGSLMSLEGFNYYLQHGSGQVLNIFGPSGGNYLGVGRTVGFAAMIAVVELIGARKWGTRLILAGLIGLFSFVLLTSGARGPLIASVLGAFVPLAFSIQFRGLESRIRIRMVVAFFALFLAGGIMAVWGG